MDENKEALDEDKLQPEDSPTPEESTEEKKTIAETEVKDLLEEEKNRYLRLFAEFENYKKRTSKEKFDSLKYADQNVLTSLLPVMDDFERALKEMNKRGNEDDVKGVELIFQKFKNTLKDKGLATIKVEVGDTFNVDQHEAITQIPAPNEDLKGKVVDVIQTGYILHDKVIRFAKVVVGA